MGVGMKRRSVLIGLGGVAPLGIMLGNESLAQEAGQLTTTLPEWNGINGVADVTGALRNPDSAVGVELADNLTGFLSPQLAPCGPDDPHVVFREQLGSLDPGISPTGADYLQAIDGAASAAFGDQYTGFQTPFGFAFTEPVDCAPEGIAAATDTMSTTATATASIEWPPDPDTDPPDE